MRFILFVLISLLDCICAPFVLLLQLPMAVFTLLSYSASEIRYALTGARTSIEDGLPYIEVEYSYVGA